MFRRDRGKGGGDKSHSGLPKEVIKKIQRIHIHTNYLVNDVLAEELTSDDIVMKCISRGV